MQEERQGLVQCVTSWVAGTAYSYFIARRVQSLLGRDDMDGISEIGAPAIDPLTEALGNRDWLMRMRASRALGQIADPGSLPALNRALTDSEMCVRSEAAEALRKIVLANPEDPKSVDAVSAFVEAIKKDDPAVRWSAVAVFNKFESTVFPALVQELAVEDGPAPRNIVKTLAMMGDPVISVLANMVNGEGEHHLREKKTKVIVALIESSDDTNNQVKLWASAALIEIKEIAFPVLVEKLNDSNPGVRFGAVKTLGSMGDVRAVAPLVQAFDDPDFEVRIVAYGALWNILDKCATIKQVEVFQSKLDEGLIELRSKLSGRQDAKAKEILSDPEGLMQAAAEKKSRLASRGSELPARMPKMKKRRVTRMKKVIV